MTLSKKEKWIGLGLLISIALNMFLGGVILGRHSYGHPTSPHQAWQKKDALLKKSLSEADRDVLKNIMQRHESQLASLRRDLTVLRHDIATVGKHDGFDADALQEKMAAENQKRFEILSLMHDMRQEVYADVSEDGRQTLAKIIGMKPNRSNHSGGHMGGSAHDHSVPQHLEYFPFIWEEGSF